MPRKRDFKQLVRTRLAKTGESYSIARMRTLALGSDPTGKRANGRRRPEDFVAPAADGVAISGVAPDIYQIKVTLAEIQPEIWRRLQVPATTTLAKLHKVIQAAFDWWDYHLHQYLVDGTHYGVSHPDYSDQLPPMLDETRITLGDIRGARSIVYEYDFGDDWQHVLEIESEHTSVPPTDLAYPVCLAGARARPPEDCGGVGGYEHLLEALRDPAHPEHKDLQRWARGMNHGRTYDPERFDLAAVNKILAKVVKVARKKPERQAPKAMS